MKIGFVGLITIGGESPGAAGGVETLVEEVGARLAAMGHEVVAYSRAKYSHGPRDEHRGILLRNMPAICTKHLETITHSLISAWCASRECEIVHFHSMGPALFAVLPRLFGRRAVCTLHGLDWKRAKWGLAARLVLHLGERCALWFPHRTTVVSRTLQQYYGERHGRLVTYVPNGVTAMRSLPLGGLQRFGLEPRRYVLYLGRIVPEKGLHYLLEAFKTLDTDMRLAIVGDARHANAYADRLRRTAADDPRIVFTGPLYGHEKEQAYGNAYLFCLPSEVEGMPVSLLEAMGCGCCCLVSNLAELRDILTPPCEGLTDAAPYGEMFECGNTQDLRCKLADLIASPRRVSDIGVRAQLYAKRVFDWNEVTRQYEKLYRGLVEARR